MNTTRTISVKICLGSACYARGSRRIAEAVKTYIAENPLGKHIRLTGSRCEEMCKQGPVVMIDGTLYSEMNVERVLDALDIHLRGLKHE
ncbi:NADH-quinone oxidoreductase subunit F [candidate division KSB3 bacterium]|uniref:NADH-quinone oxidoreductase subunit F n=1 Tax=candidate division KSB3 bacterium TaxID=2044937 RepID=A0A2G6KAE7_9BACT|nr:MAG: NADH-quinone oxidoreductase subunit F [candidate division KSB3 bacterium]